MPWNSFWKGNCLPINRRISKYQETHKAFAFFYPCVCPSFAAPRRKLDLNETPNGVAEMRYLKALLIRDKSKSEDLDPFSVGLTRLARVQPSQTPNTSLFKARPKARAA
jgi:hypothetical protein